MAALKYRLGCEHCSAFVESNDPRARAGHPCRGKRGAWLALMQPERVVPKGRKGVK